MRRVGWSGCLSAALLVLSVGMPATAQAALSWSPPIPIDQDFGHPILGVACPSSSQCTAVDNDGAEVTFNPGSPGSPVLVAIDGGDPTLNAIACPSSTQCTAVDSFGNEVTFNPQSPGTPTPVEATGQAQPGSNSLGGIACPSTDQCTAINGQGQEVTFDPNAPGTPTLVATSSPEFDATAIACPSSSQCIVVDGTGNELAFNPQTPGTPTPAVIDTGNPLLSIACPTTTRCTAVDGVGRAGDLQPGVTGRRDALDDRFPGQYDLADHRMPIHQSVLGSR